MTLGLKKLHLASIRPSSDAELFVSHTLLNQNSSSRKVWRLNLACVTAGRVIKSSAIWTTPYFVFWLIRYDSVLKLLTFEDVLVDDGWLVAPKAVMDCSCHTFCNRTSTVPLFCFRQTFFSEIGYVWRFVLGNMCSNNLVKRHELGWVKAISQIPNNKLVKYSIIGKLFQDGMVNKMILCKTVAHSSYQHVGPSTKFVVWPLSCVL